MKHLIVLTTTVCMLLSALCGCSASGRLDPYHAYNRPYSNVSTTQDGRVNGRNDSSDQERNDNRKNRRSYVNPNANTLPRSGNAAQNNSRNLFSDTNAR